MKLNLLPNKTNEVHLILLLQSWKSGKNGEPLHHHYSQVHSVQEN